MRRRAAIVVGFGWLVAAGLGACAGESAARNDGAPVAECVVCRENGDLACLHVRVHENTPRTEYQGKTYYFCSEACREEFLKDPAKYGAK